MTTGDNATQHPSIASGEGLLARHPLLFYVLIAYLGTWIVWLPFLLSADGLGIMSFSSPLPLIVIGGLGTFTGPALGAFVMTGITEGREGVRRLLHKIVLWRVGLRWYLFTFLGFPVILTLGTILVPGNLASFEPMDPLPLLGSFLLFFIYPALLIGGPLGEEPGWRGFAASAAAPTRSFGRQPLARRPLDLLARRPVWLLRGTQSACSTSTTSSCTSCSSPPGRSS
jgi:uncharacterized protein